MQSLVMTEMCKGSPNTWRGDAAQRGTLSTMRGNFSGRSPTGQTTCPKIEYIMSMVSRSTAALLVAHSRRQGPPEVRLWRASVTLQRALSPRARLLAQMQL